MSRETDTSEHGADGQERVKVPLRIQSGIYAAQAFSNSSECVVAIVVPLWALTLDASPLLIGVILGARYFIPALLAIHGGSLMDRVGVRRVLIWITLLGAVTPFLFPLVPSVIAAIGLQVIGGLSSTCGVVGSQAQIGRIMKGDPVYAGRADFVLRLGQFGGQLLAGISWDLAGPWGGFGVLAVWGVGLFLSSVLMPEDKREECSQPKNIGEVLPKASDYFAAFRLMVMPMIMLGVVMTVLRVAGNSMQNSFYVVYLEGIGYPGTTIALFLGAASVVGLIANLTLAPLTRMIKPYWLLLSTISVGIVLVAITPLLGGVFLLLIAVAALRGGAVGISGPLITSVLAQAASPGVQGKVAGLRATANRLSACLVPILMGGIVDLVGIEQAFFIVGCGLTSLTLISGFYVKYQMHNERLVPMTAPRY